MNISASQVDEMRPTLTIHSANVVDQQIINWCPCPRSQAKLIAVSPHWRLSVCLTTWMKVSANGWYILGYDNQRTNVRCAFQQYNTSHDGILQCVGLRHVMHQWK